jgi:signal transduction histidine kinase/CheY-like chemotaxis protein
LPIQLIHADSLKSGIQHLQEQKFDAILLDLTLPDSHGIDTLLKVMGAAPDTVIVVLTGTDDEELGLNAVQRGAQDYLSKSDVTSKLLLRSIHYAIERYRTEMVIRKSEQEYRSLINDVFNTSMVAVLILNRDYQVVWCSEAAELYFGIPKERLLGRDSRILIDQELKCIFADPDDYASRLSRAYQDGEFTDKFECQVLPEGNRSARWLEHWSQPIQDGMYAGGRIEQYMDITNRKLLEMSELDQRHFSEALREIFTQLTSTLSLKEVLGHILSNLGRIVPHDSASITMLDQEQIDINENTVSYLPDEVLGKQSNTYIGAPIRLQNEIIGFLYVFSIRPGFFKAIHAERLLAFAELSAIAIQNARLFQQSQALTTFEERQRLARDLHDSVSQTLFTARNMAESSLRRWDKDPARARELAEEVHQLTITALAEMRILLLELRPSSLTQISLKQLFEQYLQPIQNRRQFNINFTIADIAPVPPDVQIALYRIVQEALNNIDKHARATEVMVQIAEDDVGVILEINDDGAGFDVEAIGGTSLGLGIMRERAEGIGATIDIESQIGIGTRITVIWHRTITSG